MAYDSEICHVFSFNERNGSSGADTIINGGEYATINGGDGNDLIKNTTFGNGAVLNGGAGIDTIISDGEDVVINTGKGDDIISIAGGSALIRLDADDGNDTLYGFNDWTQFDLQHYGLREQGNDLLLIWGKSSILLKDVTRDRLKKVVRGTDSDDFINGTSQRPEYINGGGGNDTIINGFRLSTLVGAAGNDYLENSYRYASLVGGKGNDTLVNSGEYSTLDGSAGNDSIRNSGSSATLRGGAGNDTIINTGSAWIGGGAGNDYVLGKSYAVIDGNDGDDTIIAEDSYMQINGGADNDLISLGSTVRDATISAGAGNDLVYLGDYSAVIRYAEGDGNDTVFGLSTNKILDFEYDSVERAGNDLIMRIGDGSITFKNPDADMIERLAPIAAEGNGVTIENIYNHSKNILGSAGDDSLVNTGSASDGSGFAMTINGADGNDTIINKTIGWNSSLVGGAGDDFISNESAFVLINGGAGDDSISNSGGSVSIFGGAGDDSISNESAGVSIAGGDGNDVIINNGRVVTLNAGKGDDLISLKGGGEVRLEYAAGDGNDTIVGFSALTTLAFDYDTIEPSGDDYVVKVGGNSITLKDAPDFLFMPTITGNGYVTVKNSNRYVITGQGRDTVFDSHKNDLLINVGAGNDSIFINDGTRILICGGDGQDTIDINSGSDITINGGRGNDVINIIKGSACIEYAAGDGYDTVYGFNDKSSIAFDYDSIQQSGSNAVVRVGKSGFITFTNTPIERLYPKVNGSDSADNIINEKKFAQINAGGGNDTIINTADTVTINGGAGDDLISLVGGSARIEYTSGNDTIFGFDENATLDFDYDSIAQAGADVVMKVGDGSITLKDTSIEHFISTATINGDEALTLNDGLVRVEYSSGNATVYGFDENTTLAFDYDSIARSGDDVIMSIGDGSITFKDVSLAQILDDLNGLVGTNGDDSISNANSDVFIDGRNGNDTITNSGANATVEGGTGDDVISLDGGSARIFFQAGDGNDTLFGFDENTSLDFDYDSIIQSGKDVVVAVGDGSLTLKDTSLYLLTGRLDGTNQNDTIINKASNKYILAGAGDDYILNKSRYVIINGGGGNDSIINSNARNVTINAGAGDDLVSLVGGSALINYAAGDGDDTVIGFSDKTTLDFNYDDVQQSGNDVIMSIGDGSITFKNTALSLFNDENSNDQLSTILEPAAPVELGDIDLAVSKIFLSIDKQFGVTTTANRRKK